MPAPGRLSWADLKRRDDVAMRAPELPGVRRSAAAPRISPDAAASYWPNPPADSPGEFASRVRGFGLELIQIGRGRFTANGLQVQTGKALLSNVQLGPVVVQNWTAPMRSTTIAVKACDVGALWGGFRLENSDTLLIGPAANVEIVSGPEFRFVAATFPQRDFQRAVESHGFEPQIGGSGIILIRLPDLETAKRLRGANEAAISQALTHPSVRPAAEPGPRDNLLELVVSIASTGLRINPHDRHLGRWRGVDHAVAAMRTQPPDTLSSAELRRAAGVSERALRKGFVERYTLPPGLSESVPTRWSPQGPPSPRVARAEDHRHRQQMGILAPRPICRGLPRVVRGTAFANCQTGHRGSGKNVTGAPTIALMPEYDAWAPRTWAGS